MTSVTKPNRAKCMNTKGNTLGRAKESVLRPFDGSGGIAGANRHQMPAATKEEHAKGFFAGIEADVGMAVPGGEKNEGKVS